jgi:hypothetical protein
MNKTVTAGLFFTLLSLITSLSIPAAACAASPILTDPVRFSTTHHDKLLQIPSKDEAVQFFLTSEIPQTSPSKGRYSSDKSSPQIHVSPEIQESIARIMAGLSAMAFLNARTDQSADTSPIREPAVENLPGPPPEWLADFMPREKLKVARILQDMANQFSLSSDWIPETDEQAYFQFAHYYDQTYSGAPEGLNTWIQVFQDNGMAGINSKLQEFWQTQAGQVHQTTLSESQKRRYATHYQSTRLQPTIQAYMTNQMLRLQTEAFELLLTQIPIITQWRHDMRQNSGLARICGTWHWTVHNHMNHQDHKMTVNFLPPDQTAPSTQPMPTTIAVRGDTVYLEWTFPQGRQEDSLLLSNRDTIMEGTFKNTLGPYGSISGKRLSTCKP